MRIYLAARFSRREELRGYAGQLRADGPVVDVRWLSEEHDLPVGAPPEAGVRFALDDFEDLAASDAIVSFTEEPGKALGGGARGGRHVEFGVALGFLRATVGAYGPSRLLVVGWRENIFHYLPDVEFFETWDEARRALSTELP